jgi:CubicO group peptidase (beta-lactamase class C family)
MTLRDYGRVGQFILDGGAGVLPAGWTKEATSKEIDNGERDPSGGYGYFWWIRSADRYEAVGIFGQSITTFRDERLIIVQNAAWPKATGRDLSAARSAMLEAVRKAATAK